MRNKLIKKTLSIALALSILANISSQTHAADLVAIPQNVRTPILTPAPTQTRSTELSFQSFEAKISNILKPEKKKAKLAATYSGACGTGVTYNLDTTAGVLTISGAGAMTDYLGSSDPWYSYRSSIKTVVIENGVTSIGSYAFYSCNALTEVSIPDSVTYIGESAFQYGNALTSITVDSNNSNYKSINGVLFNKAVTTLIQYPAGKSGGYTIPDSVTSIGHNAFYDCDALTSVSIPDSVTSIGSYAFSYCKALTEVSISDSVTYIGESAFYFCDALTEVSYAGTSDPGASYNNVFTLTQVTPVNVPWNYESSTFCGVNVSRMHAPLTATFTAPLEYVKPKFNKVVFSVFFYLTD